MYEIQHIDLSKEKRTRILCVTYCCLRETITNTKKKISIHLEEIQKERIDSAIWLEVQTLKDRMSNLYHLLYLIEFSIPILKQVTHLI